MTEPCDLSAVDALANILSKKLSLVELLQSCIDRIDLVNPALNAVVASDNEAGMARAREITEKIYKGESVGV